MCFLCLFSLDRDLSLALDRLSLFLDLLSFFLIDCWLDSESYSELSGEELLSSSEEEESFLLCSDLAF